MRREEAARMSFDELEAAGVCDCGEPLEGHPPLALPRPLSERGERVPPFGAASAGMGRGIQVRRPGRGSVVRRSA